MPLTGTEVGSLGLAINCGGLKTSGNTAFAGTGNPTWGISLPAGIAGTASGTAAHFTVPTATDTLVDAQTIAVFWVSGGVQHAAYNIVVATITPSGGTDTVVCTMTNAIYLVGGDSALPTTGAIIVSTGQVLTATDSVSILGSSLQQLLAIASQPCLLSWQKSDATVERASVIAAAGGYDTYPATQAQVGVVPWTGTDTVSIIQCYNNSTAAATVNISVIVA